MWPTAKCDNMCGVFQWFARSVNFPQGYSGLSPMVTFLSATACAKCHVILEVDLHKRCLHVYFVGSVTGDTSQHTGLTCVVYIVCLPGTLSVVGGTIVTPDSCLSLCSSDDRSELKVVERLSLQRVI